MSDAATGSNARRGDPAARRRGAAETARPLDAKTKPRGSLGRLEDIAAGSRRSAAGFPSTPAPAIVVVAADHGVAAESVSAYPQEVTAQMLANFAAGGAAICVLAREAGARLVVVDAGVIGGAGVTGVRARSTTASAARTTSRSARR